jgi:hypothetical protein
MIQRAWVMIVLITVVGAAIVGAGAAISESLYWSAVLAGLGTTILLAIPVILLGRLMDRRLNETRTETTQLVGALDDRIQSVEDSVHGVSNRLDHLTQTTDTRIAEQRSSDLQDLRAPAAAILQDPSFETVYDALVQAKEQGAIGSSIFLDLSDIDFTLMLWTVSAGLNYRSVPIIARLDDSDVPKSHAQHDWRETETIEECFVALDKAMRHQFGDRTPKLSLKAVLHILARTIDVALRFRAAAGSSTTHTPKVVQMPTDHWVITTRALEHVGDNTTSFKADDVLIAGSTSPNLEADIPHAQELDRAWRAAHSRYLTLLAPIALAAFYPTEPTLGRGEYRAVTQLVDDSVRADTRKSKDFGTEVRHAEESLATPDAARAYVAERVAGGLTLRTLTGHVLLTASHSMA